MKKSVAKEMMLSNPQNIFNIQHRFLKDDIFFLFCINLIKTNEQSCYLMKVNDDNYHFSGKWSENKEVILKLVSLNGNWLEYASERLKDDEEIVMQAVKEYGGSFIHCNKRLKNSKIIIMEAIKTYFPIITLISDEFKNDIDILRLFKCSLEIYIKERPISFRVLYTTFKFYLKQLEILELEQELNNIAPINNVSTKIVKF